MQENKTKMKNVFEETKNNAKVEEISHSLAKMQLIFEKLSQIQNETRSQKTVKLCEALKKQVSKKINKLSKKIDQVSQILRVKNSCISQKKDNFDFLRNEQEFNYEISPDSQKGAFDLQTDIRNMEMVELNRLTENIQSVNKLFMNMGNLVFEQGTIVDRIDANVYLTVEKVENGNLQLIRAIEHQNSSLADLFIKVLGFIVIGLTFLLFLKYS